jgi:hypothetical protein
MAGFAGRLLGSRDHMADCKAFISSIASFKPKSWIGKCNMIKAPFPIKFPILDDHVLHELVIVRLLQWFDNESSWG